MKTVTKEQAIAMDFLGCPKFDVQPRQSVVRSTVTILIEDYDERGFCGYHEVYSLKN